MSDQEQKNQDTGPAVRRLTPEEQTELRRDMAEASAWARAERLLCSALSLMGERAERAH
jgi:hypothetical protein